eukprot:TRINITY_DN297_c1_g1_i1.p1 TRINITY_DN297_c1_g1~~TRINITY_DN297_c1_g1_i1.p1  ORF type:complete len:3241 (+),score=1439.60 TRINITY_DN297_c1_g1_i1:167-9724(+)
MQEAEIEDLKKAGDVAKLELEAAERKLEVSEGRVSELTAKVVELAEESRASPALRRHVSDLDKSVADARRAAAQASDELKVKQEVLQRVMSEKVRLEVDLENRAEQIAALQGDARQLKAEISVQKADAASRQKEFDDGKQAVARAEAENAGLQDRLETMVKRTNAMSEKILALSGELREAKAGMSRRASNAAVAEDAEKLAAAHKAAAEELEQSELLNVELEQALNEATDKAAALEMKLQAFEHFPETDRQTAEELGALRLALSQEQQRGDDLAKRNDALSAELRETATGDAARKDNEEAAAKAEADESLIAELRAKVAAAEEEVRALTEEALQREETAAALRARIATWEGAGALKGGLDERRASVVEDGAPATHDIDPPSVEFWHAKAQATAAEAAEIKASLKESEELIAMLEEELEAGNGGERRSPPLPAAAPPASEVASTGATELAEVKKISEWLANQIVILEVPYEADTESAVAQTETGLSGVSELTPGDDAAPAGSVPSQLRQGLVSLVSSYITLQRSGEEAALEVERLKDAAQKLREKQQKEKDDGLVNEVMLLVSRQQELEKQLAAKTEALRAAERSVSPTRGQGAEYGMLCRELDETRGKLETARDKIATLDGEALVLRRTIDNLNNDREELTAANEELMQQVSDIMTRELEAEDVIEAQKQQAVQARRDFQVAEQRRQDEMSDLLTFINELEAENAEFAKHKGQAPESSGAGSLVRTMQELSARLANAEEENHRLHVAMMEKNEEADTNAAGAEAKAKSQVIASNLCVTLSKRHAARIQGLQDKVQMLSEQNARLSTQVALLSTSVCPPSPMSVSSPSSPGSPTGARDLEVVSPPSPVAIDKPRDAPKEAHKEALMLERILSKDRKITELQERNLELEQKRAAQPPKRAELQESADLRAHLEHEIVTWQRKAEMFQGEVAQARQYIAELETEQEATAAALAEVLSVNATQENAKLLDATRKGREEHMRAIQNELMDLRTAMLDVDIDKHVRSEEVKQLQRQLDLEKLRGKNLENEVDTLCNELIILTETEHERERPEDDRDTLRARMDQQQKLKIKEKEADELRDILSIKERELALQTVKAEDLMKRVEDLDMQNTALSLELLELADAQLNAEEAMLDGIEIAPSDGDGSQPLTPHAHPSTQMGRFHPPPPMSPERRPRSRTRGTSVRTAGSAADLSATAQLETMLHGSTSAVVLQHARQRRASISSSKGPGSAGGAGGGISEMTRLRCVAKRLDYELKLSQENLGATAKENQELTQQLIDLTDDQIALEAQWNRQRDADRMAAKEREAQLSTKIAEVEEQLGQMTLAKYEAERETRARVAGHEKVVDSLQADIAELNQKMKEGEKVNQELLAELGELADNQLEAEDVALKEKEELFESVNMVKRDKFEIKKQYEAEIADIRERLYDAERQLGSQRTLYLKDRAAHELEAKALRDELEEKKDKMEDLKDEIAALKNQHRTPAATEAEQASLAEKERLMAVLEGKKDDLHRELLQTRIKLSETQAENQEAQLLNERLAAKAAQFSSTNHDLTTKMEAMRDQLIRQAAGKAAPAPQAAAHDNSELEQEVEVLKEKVKTLTKRLANEEDRNTEMSRDMTEVVDREQKLVEAMRSAEKERNDAKAHARELQKRLLSLNASRGPSPGQLTPIPNVATIEDDASKGTAPHSLRAPSLVVSDDTVANFTIAVPGSPTASASPTHSHAAKMKSLTLESEVQVIEAEKRALKHELEEALEEIEQLLAEKEDMHAESERLRSTSSELQQRLVKMARSRVPGSGLSSRRESGAHLFVGGGGGPASPRSDGGGSAASDGAVSDLDMLFDGPKWKDRALRAEARYGDAEHSKLADVYRHCEPAGDEKPGPASPDESLKHMSPMSMLIVVELQLLELKSHVDAAQAAKSVMNMSLQRTTSDLMKAKQEIKTLSTPPNIPLAPKPAEKKDEPVSPGSANSSASGPATLFVIDAEHVVSDYSNSPTPSPRGVTGYRRPPRSPRHGTGGVAVGSPIVLITPTEESGERPYSPVHGRVPPVDRDALTVSESPPPSPAPRTESDYNDIVSRPSDFEDNVGAHTVKRLGGTPSEEPPVLALAAGGLRRPASASGSESPGGAMPNRARGRSMLAMRREQRDAASSRASSREQDAGLLSQWEIAALQKKVRELEALNEAMVKGLEEAGDVEERLEAALADAELRLSKTSASRAQTPGAISLVPLDISAMSMGAYRGNSRRISLDALSMQTDVRAAAAQSAASSRPASRAGGMRSSSVDSSGSRGGNPACDAASNPSTPADVVPGRWIQTSPFEAAGSPPSATISRASSAAALRPFGSSRRGSAAVGALNGIIVSLTEQVEALEAENAVLSNQVGGLVTHNQQLEDAADIIEDRLRRGEGDAAAELFTEQRLRIAELESKASSLTADVKASEDIEEKLRAQLREMQQRIVRLGKSKQQQEADNQHVVDALEAKIAELEEEGALNRSIEEKLRLQLRGMQEKILTISRSTRAEVDAAPGNPAAAIQNLSLKCENLEAELRRARAESSDAQTSLSHQTGALGELEAENARLKAASQRLETQVAKLEEDLAGEAFPKAARVDVPSAEDLKRKFLIKELLTEKELSTTTAEALRDRVRELQAQLQDQEKLFFGEGQELRADFRARYTDLHNELLKAERKQQRHTRELAKQIQDHEAVEESLRTQLRAMQTRLSRLAAANSDLTDEVDALRKGKAEAGARHTAEVESWRQRAHEADDRARSSVEDRMAGEVDALKQQLQSSTATAARLPVGDADDLRKRLYDLEKMMLARGEEEADAALAQEAAALRTTNAVFQQELQANASQIAALHDRLRVVEAANLTLEEQKLTFEARLAKAAQLAPRCAEDEEAAVQRLVRSFQAEIDALTAETKALSKKALLWDAFKDGMHANREELASPTSRLRYWKENGPEAEQAYLWGVGVVRDREDGEVNEKLLNRAAAALGTTQLEQAESEARWQLNATWWHSIFHILMRFSRPGARRGVSPLRGMSPPVAAAGDPLANPHLAHVPTLHEVRSHRRSPPRAWTTPGALSPIARHPHPAAAPTPVEPRNRSPTRSRGTPGLPPSLFTPPSALHDRNVSPPPPERRAGTAAHLSRRRADRQVHQDEYFSRLDQVQSKINRLRSNLADTNDCSERLQTQLLQHMQADPTLGPQADPVALRRRFEDPQ